jgi:hypothetical protein
MRHRIRPLRAVAATAPNVQPEHHHRASACSIPGTGVKATLFDADVIVGAPQ